MSRFICDLLAVTPLQPVTEAVTQEELSSVLEKLRKSKGWKRAGKPIYEVRAEIDPDFIRHEIHYDRMVNGGTDDEGRTIRASRGVRKVTLEATEGTAILTVDGSREWDKDKHDWRSRIGFTNYDLIRKAPGLTWTERARLLLKDNVKVHCDCPAFQYFHAYTATKKGFGLIPENRPSNITNPERNGGVCKHLQQALRVIGTNYTSLATGLKQHSTQESTVSNALVSSSHTTISEALSYALSASFESDDEFLIVEKDGKSVVIRKKDFVTDPKMKGVRVKGVVHKGMARKMAMAESVEEMIPSPSANLLSTLKKMYEQSSRAGMARTAQALNLAISSAKVEGATSQEG